MANALTHPTGNAIALPGPVFGSARPSSKSGVHRLALALVALCILFSAVVVVEPAPVDFLAVGLMFLLPLVGLTATRPLIFGLAACWAVIAGLSLFGAAWSRDLPAAASHTAISIYLFASSILFACFVARNPRAHTQLLLSVYFVTAVFAAALGIIGYLDLFPSAYQHLTQYDRATGLFKDPNVYAPFLIPGLLMALHYWLNRSVVGGVVPAIAALILIAGIFVSFSRGAWAATVVALLMYCYLSLITAKTDWRRIKLVLMLIAGAAVAGVSLLAAMQSDQFARFLGERATLTQSYDTGSDGRFGGQEKAINIILDNPLGIGFGSFSRFYHPEEVHNVYLSMTLNAGWLGGLLFFIICSSTIGLGFLHALTPSRAQPLFLVAYASVTGIILEGSLVDIDHWRHLYLLIGIVWGLMAADHPVVRSAKIVRDVRPVLKRKLLIIPPSRRHGRIISAPTPHLLVDFKCPPAARKARRRRRPPRLRGGRPLTLPPLKPKPVSG